MKNKKWIIITMFFFVLMGEIYNYYDSTIPDTLNVLDADESLNLQLPAMASVTEEKADTSSGYCLNVNIFGVFNIKNVDVEVIDKQKYIPCGIPIGIYIKADGLLVLSVDNVKDINGNTLSPSKDILKADDYILAINGNSVDNIYQFQNLINQNGSESMVLTIRRNNETIDVKVNPAQITSDEYRIGAWVRSDTQGIGTLTYIDSEKNYGALGHSINDIDTGSILESSDGNIYKAQILSIIRGEAGIPGELSGMINYSSDNILGTIVDNSGQGIFGHVDDNVYSYLEQTDSMNIGLKQDVKTGKAYIRSYVSGEVADYEIEITKVDIAESDANKGLTFTVTDAALIDITGGIVQGMSGSPIIQDGKIIGAVTHVLVKDPLKGYGIFIENMIEN